MGMKGPGYPRAAMDGRAGTGPRFLEIMTANSASAPKDAIFSISFPTKPENDMQTRITAEISQYFTSRGCQVVFQQGNS